MFRKIMVDTRIPGMGSVDARMLMQDIYETEFGIFDHLSNGQQRPMASVAMLPMEDVDTGSLREESYRLYVRKKIWDNFHLNYDEFVSRPHYEIEMMIGVADEEGSRRSASEEADAANLLSALQQKNNGN